MTVAYSDPTSNGTNTFSYGSYTNVDDAVRQPTAPTESPVTTERIYGNENASPPVCELNFTLAAVADQRITNIKFWQYTSVAGSLNTTREITFDGVVLQTTNVNSAGWTSTEWQDAAYDLSSAISAKVKYTAPATIAKDEDEDEIAACYFEYTYEDVSAEDECYTAAAHGKQSGTVVVLNDGSVKNIDDAGEFVAFQFNQVQLEQAETITSATLIFKTGGDEAGDITIHAEDSDDAPVLTVTANDISGRTTTTAVVNETSYPEGENHWKGFDVTAILQELVDRAGWVDAARVVFILEGATPAVDDYKVDLGETAQLCIDHPTAIPTPTGEDGIVVPDMDGTNAATNWTITGGPTTRFGAMNNGIATPDDTDYIYNYISEGSGAESAYWGFSELPYNFLVANSCSVKVRQKGYNNLDDDVTYQIFKADGTTALTDAITLAIDGSGVSTTFRTDTLNFTITGDTDRASWDAALIKVTHHGPGDGDDPELWISEMEMTVGSTTTGGGSGSPWYYYAQQGGM